MRFPLLEVIGTGQGDLACILRSEQVCVTGTSIPVVDKRSEQRPGVRDIARLLAQLALRGLEGLLAGFQVARREMDSDPGRTPLVVPLNHDAVTSRGEDDRVIRHLEAVEAFDLTSVGQPKLLLEDAEPGTPIEHLPPGEHLPLRRDRAAHVASSVSLLTSTRCAPSAYWISRRPRDLFSAATLKRAFAQRVRRRQGMLPNGRTPIDEGLEGESQRGPVSAGTVSVPSV
jgi:hypothetical protein